MLMLTIGLDESVRLNGLFVKVGGAMVPAGEVRIVLSRIRYHRQQVKLGMVIPEQVEAERIDPAGVVIRDYERRT